MGTLGAYIMPLAKIIELELTNFQLSKCTARIHTGFCVVGGR